MAAERGLRYILTFLDAKGLELGLDHAIGHFGEELENLLGRWVDEEFLSVLEGECGV